jgi:L,D-peptidoglycan transpeptidase YkuD (ErfK/YbiS/YcfS/YnhG family)
MFRFCPAIAVTMGAALGLGGLAAGKSPAGKATPCGQYGTSIVFEDTPADASRQAAKDEKLVMVLHISGHFEDPRFT